MSDIKQYEPLWGSWYIESLIGQGSYGKVYKVRRSDLGRTYSSAVKIISIPSEDNEIRQMRSEGLNDETIQQCLQVSVRDIVREIDLMSEFRGNSNIVSFEDYGVIEKKDSIGWHILIRTELLQPLLTHVRKAPLTKADVVKLGIHICRALELCAQKNIIHRDVKPDNIFISQYGEYKLGDFGIARHIENTLSGLSRKGTSSYMAPEVFKGERYGPKVDTYALGIVMYRFLNHNRIPFMPDYPQSLESKDREQARHKRMRGDPIPPLKNVSPKLNGVVLKACAHDPHKRFDSAAEMRQALEALAKSGNYEPWRLFG
ncbi:MAG: serine/threonine protein kinase [Peptococcaceae bacterium]|nr:serine/threonine protein kinase [Peptococcaceae bacterium]